MSPRTEEQLQSHREMQRGKIIQAAMELFAENSYNITSISQIAKAAGVAKGLIYTYFPSKEELLIAVVMSGMENMGEMGNADAPMETKQDFEDFIRLMFAMLEAMPDYWKVYFGVFLQPNVLQIIGEKLSHILNGYMEIFTGYYTAQGVQNPAGMARMLLAYLDGIGIHLLYVPEGLDKELTIQLTVERFG